MARTAWHRSSGVSPTKDGSPPCLLCTWNLPTSRFPRPRRLRSFTAVATGVSEERGGFGLAWRRMGRWLGRALMLVGALMVVVEASPLTEIWASALAGR